VNYHGPGRYRHYKGNEYEVLGLAVREDTRDDEDNAILDVIYKSDEEAMPGVSHWSRRLDDFDAVVDGIPRFVLVAPA
jgi:hypothetical protein